MYEYYKEKLHVYNFWELRVNVFDRNGKYFPSKNFKKLCKIYSPIYIEQTISIKF